MNDWVLTPRVQQEPPPTDCGARRYWCGVARIIDCPDCGAEASMDTKTGVVLCLPCDIRAHDLSDADRDRLP